jgi:hypothetical protein
MQKLPHADVCLDFEIIGKIIRKGKMHDWSLILHKMACSALHVSGRDLRPGYGEFVIHDSPY